MRYRLVIFDFDGTLADSFPFFLEASDLLADAHGFRKIRSEELETIRGYGARQILQHVGLPAWKLPRVALHYRQLMARQTMRIPLFQGVDQMLQDLSAQNIMLALVTSNSLENVRNVLGPNNAARIAHYECGVSMFGKRSRLRKILQHSGVPAQQTLCIGDELRDIDAAHAEGLAFGAVAWGYTRFDMLLARQPEHAFSAVAEIAHSVLDSVASKSPTSYLP